MSATNRAQQETIVAIATPSGFGGIGVIRLSGPSSWAYAGKLSGVTPELRKVRYANFKNNDGLIIDSGLMVGFEAPHSFTGEDVVEIQGHAGPVVQDLLIAELVRMGARQAKAGEFSQRAFLNDKIDLAQAEAIADLINSSTEQAALGAMRSLQGEFSKKIDDLLVKLIFLRSYVEAAIDFPEEEIDFLADDTVQTKLSELRLALDTCLQQTQQGAILKNGFTLVLAGKPNAGKSSLLNYLSGLETAIVTEIPGTTRDIVSQTIDIDGLPVHVLDTAGLRDTNDPVEKIGVAKAQKAIEEADHILVLQDINDKEAIDIELPQDKLTQINTKLDLQPQQSTGEDAIGISIIDGTGIEELKTHIKKLAGFHSDGETLFTARRRHIAALEQASDALNQGIHQLETNKAGELLAEELLAAQNAINEITGEFKSDDLLGQIFGSFCIGK